MSENPSAPTWQQTYPVTGPSDGQTFSAGIQCSNMPTDGFVAVTMPGPDPASSLNIPRTRIANPNWQIAQRLQWPDDFSSEMTISYWQGNTPPPGGASIEPVVMVVSAAAAADTLGPFWQKTVALTVTEGVAAVGIQCRNMPADASIAIFSPGPRQGRGVQIPQTILGASDRNFTIPVDWTDGSQTILVISYWQGPTVPDPDAVVTPFVAVSTDGRNRPAAPVRLLSMGWQALTGREAI
jgi:hypothetical protein